MSEIFHPVFGRHDPELICECGHSRKYHNQMGLSENLTVGTNCNACYCREFEESTQNTQDIIIRLRKKIKSRRYAAEATLTKIDNELIQLQERCSHPNQKSQPEYDFTAYWCDDCDKHWTGRR